MKKIITIVVLTLVCGLGHAQKGSTPAAPADSKNPSTTVANGAPASNERGTRGKSTPIIARTAQPGLRDSIAPSGKEGMKTASPAPAPAALPAKSGK